MPKRHAKSVLFKISKHAINILSVICYDSFTISVHNSIAFCNVWYLQVITLCKRLWQYMQWGQYGAESRQCFDDISAHISCETFWQCICWTFVCQSGISIAMRIANIFTKQIKSCFAAQTCSKEILATLWKGSTSQNCLLRESMTTTMCDDLCESILFWNKPCTIHVVLYFETYFFIFPIVRYKEPEHGHSSTLWYIGKIIWWKYV